VDVSLLNKQLSFKNLQTTKTTLANVAQFPFVL